MQIVDVVAGGVHTCILTNNGSVVCWGENAYGQLGYGHNATVGDDEMPFTVGFVNSGSVPIAQLAAGYRHTCALTSNGSVLCWGFNLYGQLGYGHNKIIGDNEYPVSAGYVLLPGAISVKQLVAGLYHTCVLATNGSVACWGYNTQGQLGLGHANMIGDNELPSSSAFAQLGVGIQSIGSGPVALHTCAISTNGSALCWGCNTYGQLGYGHVNNVGDNEYPSAAGFISAGSLIVFFDVRAGYGHTCASFANGVK
jgi:alpha-tubulin suppressor-like RCC1 family protein